MWMRIILKTFNRKIESEEFCCQTIKRLRVDDYRSFN